MGAPGRYREDDRTAAQAEPPAQGGASSFVNHRRGFPTEARAMAERGIKLAREPADRERFQLLRSSLDAPPPAGAPAPAASAPARESFLDGLTTLERPAAPAPPPPPPPAPRP